MEDLAYRRMLDLYYVREQALPLSVPEIARLIRLRGQEDLIENVLNEFFQRTETGWVHAKCEEVIAAAQKKRASAQASANKRWGNADGMPTHSEGNADALRSDSEGNAPSPTSHSHSQKNPPKPPKGGEPEGFAEFYEAYPRKTARPRAAKAFAKVRVPLPVLLAAIERQKRSDGWTKDGGKFIPHPATWLNDERWNDQTVDAEVQPEWWESRSGVERKADELGLPPWDQIKEQWPQFLARVRKAAKEQEPSLDLTQLAAMAAHQKGQH